MRILANIAVLAAFGMGAEALATDRLVPSQYPTIQAGISVAAEGDHVVIAPGTYTGPGNRDLDFLGKAITVRSADPNDPNTVAGTVIDPNQNGRGFHFQSGEDANSVLTGVTITNATPTDAVSGAAIRCEGSSPTITKCVITGNSAAGLSGGGICCIYSACPTISDCEITGTESLLDSG